MPTVNVNINSSSWIFGISRDTVRADLYRMFFNAVYRSITDPRLAYRNKWIYPSFPDADIDEGKIDYPIIIIDSVEPSWDKKTLEQKWTMARINISVFSTNSSQADDLVQDVDNAMLSNRGKFMLAGVKMLTLDSSASDRFKRGDALTVHLRRSTYTCQYSWRVYDV